MPRVSLAWGIGLAVWVTALALLAPHDLAISKAVADPASPFGVFVYRFGGWPSLLAYALAVPVLLWPRRGRSAVDPWRVAALAVVLMGLVHAFGLTHLVKYAWGRLRFVQLAADFSDYTPFYVPAGVGRGVSFPSGHTATAFALLPIPIALWRARRRGGAAIVGLLVLAWGVVVAAGRIRAGAHFATDTVFSAGVALLLAPLVVRVTEALLALRGRAPELVPQGAKPKLRGGTVSPEVTITPPSARKTSAAYTSAPSSLKCSGSMSSDVTSTPRVAE